MAKMGSLVQTLAGPRVLSQWREGPGPCPCTPPACSVFCHFPCCLHTSRVLPLCPTLCGPMDCIPPGSFVQRFSRQEYWSGFIPFSRGSSQPRDQTHVFHVFCIGRQVLYANATWEMDMLTFHICTRTFKPKSILHGHSHLYLVQTKVPMKQERTGSFTGSVLS